MKASDSTVNDSAQWDRVWAAGSDRLKERLFSAEQIKRQAAWSTAMRLLRDVDPKSLSTIEIGAGAGTASTIFARMGARVTILDYAPEALTASEDLFRELGLTREPVLADALNPPAALRGKFDVSMSFGLAEHFEDASRIAIIKAHFDMLRPGGLAIITVPNSRCHPYRWWKAKKQRLGTWEWGLEIPFSEEELVSICETIGITDYSIVGSPFLQTLNFVTPFSRWKRSIEKRVLKDRRFDPARIAQEEESWLGHRYGFSITLIGRQPGSKAARA